MVRVRATASAADVRVGDVEVEGVGAVARGGDGAGHRGRAGIVDVADHHAGAGLGQQVSDALADARRPAGHQRGLAVERQQLSNGCIHGSTLLS